MIKLQCPYIKCFLKKLPFITMKPCLRPQQPVEVLVLLLMKVTIIPSRNLNLLSLVRFTKCPGHLESCKVCLPYFWRCWKLHMDLELNVPINDSTILRVRTIISFLSTYMYWLTFSKTKGQLISKCPFGVIVWTKIPTKKFDKFCRGQIIR